MDVGLLTAAFSAMLGVKVVLPSQDTARLKTVSVHDLFRTTHHIMRPPVPQAVVIGRGEEFEISMMTLTGTKYPVNVTKGHTIAQVKAAVKSIHGIPIAGQRLVFNAKPLGDHETIEGLGIPPGGICCLIILGGKDATDEFVLDHSELAPGFDYDFTNECGADGERYMRGDFEYHRPYGWMRFALNVLGRKEYNRDNTWLGADGIRTASTTGEWPVSYHGTYQNAVKYIVHEGLKIGSRELHGRGVYSSPNLSMVSGSYAQQFVYNGKQYLVALQNRVNPAKVRTQEESEPPSPDPYGDCTFVIVPEKYTHAGADYWRCPRQNPDQGIYDIRPYGILIREI